MQLNPSEDSYADLVLSNANVITVDAEDSVAEAIAVKGDKIAKVGTTEKVKDFVGKRTKVMDLNGKTVLPGFIEPHNHFQWVGYALQQLNVRTPPCKTIDDVLNVVKDRAKVTPRGHWISGRGIELAALKEHRWPTRAELDAAAPDNPLVLEYVSSYACVANSKALEMAGITKDTPNPAAGVIEKDPVTNEPTGLLQNASATELVCGLIPPPTLEELKDWLVQAGREFEKVGITSVHDLTWTERPETFRAYQEVVEENRLKIRIYLFSSVNRMRHMGVHTGFGNERFRLGGVKIRLDGSIQVFTSAFYEPYLTKDTKGVLSYTPGELSDMVLEAHNLGYQVAIHAQGDYAITVAIDALEFAMWRYPRPNPRHRIEHTQCVTHEDLRRMKRLGLIASMYPYHPWYWGDRHVDTFIGMERASRIDPMKEAMDMGIVTVAHSDAPVAMPGLPNFPADPLWGMWCAVNRTTKSGVVLGPELRLSPMNAIRAYTINAAYASFEEKIKGSIEPGKLADFVVLSDSPLTVDPMDIGKIKVEKTIIGGEVVYEA